jgi:hypothetical protein
MAGRRRGFRSERASKSQTLLCLGKSGRPGRYRRTICHRAGIAPGHFSGFRRACPSWRIWRKVKNDNLPDGSDFGPPRTHGLCDFVNLHYAGRPDHLFCPVKAEKKIIGCIGWKNARRLAHSRTPRKFRGPSPIHQRLGLRRESRMREPRRFRAHEISSGFRSFPPARKRCRGCHLATALQNALQNSGVITNAPASWTAPVFWRFSIASPPRHITGAIHDAR